MNSLFSLWDCQSCGPCSPGQKKSAYVHSINNGDLGSRIHENKIRPQDQTNSLPLFNSRMSTIEEEGPWMHCRSQSIVSLESHCARLFTKSLSCQLGQSGTWQTKRRPMFPCNRKTYNVFFRWLKSRQEIVTGWAHGWGCEGDEEQGELSDWKAQSFPCRQLGSPSQILPGFYLE